MLVGVRNSSAAGRSTSRPGRKALPCCRGPVGGLGLARARALASSLHGRDASYGNHHACGPFLTPNGGRGSEVSPIRDPIQREGQRSERCRTIRT